MNENRMAVVTDSLTSVPSRRDVLRGLAGAGFGLALARLPALAEAERKRNRKLPRNEFGCVAVGEQCRGKDSVCCSGICRGPKPKNGKRDTSRCVAHDESTCPAGQSPQDVCGGAVDVACVTSTDANGACYTTTGNAAYCARESYCRACRTDADCQPFCGKAAGCVTCSGCLQGGTACASPTLGRCEFPGA